jgi:hypothetical protein
MAYEFNFDNGTFIDVDPVGSGMGSAVVPLILRKQDGGTSTVHNQGTAFCIGASAAGQLLLATARHVVTDLEDQRAGLEPMVVLPSADDPGHLVGLFVRQMSIAPAFSDVALLVVNLDEADPAVGPPKMLPITFGPPVVGQNTMALGYEHEGVPVRGEARLSYFLRASRGEVTVLHNRRRDRVLVNFPSFETTGLYKPSMSGGPIIDVAGAVVGIITTGFDVADGDPIGHGVCTGGLAELTVALTNDAGDVEEITVAALAQGGQLGRPGITLQLDRDEDGVTLTWPDVSPQPPASESDAPPGPEDGLAQP